MTDEKNPAPRKKRLPASYYYMISLAGAGLAAVSLALIFFMMALEYFGDSHSPYVGIIAFLILPAFLVLGLAIAAFGVLRQQRRRRLGLPSTEQLPKIDFNNPTHFRATVLVGGGFLLFLALTAFAVCALVPLPPDTLSLAFPPLTPLSSSPPPPSPLSLGTLVTRRRLARWRRSSEHLRTDLRFQGWGLGFQGLGFRV